MGDPLTTSEQRQDNILTQITKIENVEKSLLDLLSNSTLTPEEINNVTSNLKELTETREVLHQGLTQNYSIIHDVISQSRNNLVNQMTTTGIAEQEKISANKDLRTLNAAKNRHQRMTEINTYYGKYYQAHTYTMKLIIYAALPILLFSILSKKNILPVSIARILNILVISIFAVLLIFHLADINKRDSMVYSEYDFGTPFLMDSDDVSTDNNNSSYASQGEVCEEDLIKDLENEAATTSSAGTTTPPPADNISVVHGSDSSLQTVSADNLSSNLAQTHGTTVGVGGKGLCMTACNYCYTEPAPGIAGYDKASCEQNYGSPPNCEKCCDTGQIFDKTTGQCESDTESFQNIVRENFQNSRIPLNVAYVASPTPSCPWNKNDSIIKPFSINENYATV